MLRESSLTSGNPLMDLRLVILRTIAAVWQDDWEESPKVDSTIAPTS